MSLHVRIPSQWSWESITPHTDNRVNANNELIASNRGSTISETHIFATHYCDQRAYHSAMPLP